MAALELPPGTILTQADDLRSPDEAWLLRERHARRMHQRQILRRMVIVVSIMVFASLLTRISLTLGSRLRAEWLLKTSGFTVDWQIDEDNWTSGGVTAVGYSSRSWLGHSHDVEIKAIQSLRNVFSLNLNECNVSEQGLSVLASLGRLEDLNLSRMNHHRHVAALAPLSDACLEPLADLPRMRSLSLSGNRITDRGLETIGRMSSLETLDLELNDVTDEGIEHLLGLRRLKVLSLGGTLVTKAGIRKLQEALPGLEVNLELDPEIEQHLDPARRVKR